jgi:hypothetical protein
MRISPETGPTINLRISPPIQGSPTEEWFDIDAYDAPIEPCVEPRVEPRGVPRIIPRIEPQPTQSGEPEPTQLDEPELTQLGEPEPTQFDEPEPEPEPEPTQFDEPQPTQFDEPEPEPEPTQFGDPIIQKAQESTQKARAAMAIKYSKKHDIQHFDIGDIVSIKVPREDRTSTDNRRLFARILEEPYSHRYRVLTYSGRIRRLIPTKELGVVDKALWLGINIPDSIKEITLALAAREASTSSRVGVSCQCKGDCNSRRCRCYKENKGCSIHCHRDEHDCGNLSGLISRTEIALVDRPRRKRARADTVGNSN